MSPFKRNVAHFTSLFPLQAAQLSENLEPLPLGDPPPFPLDDLDVIYLTGVEMAAAFTILDRWPGKIVIFEGDLEKIEKLFSQVKIPERAEIVIPSREVRLKLAWDHLFLRAWYGDDDTQRDLSESVHLIASDYADLGAAVLRNIEQNGRLGEVYDGVALGDKFSGVPAVVCGAGPSLEGAYAKLRKLENRALIIACGSALPLLAAQRIRPHLFAALDPNPPMSRFLESSEMTLPLIYQNRLSHAVAKTAHGRCLCMPGSGGYPAESFLYGESCALFDAGWNAGTFGVHLARFFGCAEVFTVGIDGGRVDGKRYAGGIESSEGVADLRLGKKEIGKVLDFSAAEFPRQWDIRGILHRASLKKLRIDGEKWEAWAKSRAAVGKLLNEWIEKIEESGAKWDAFYLSALEREPFFTLHIQRVWEIMRPVIERDISDEIKSEMHRAIFYQKVATNV